MVGTVRFSEEITSADKYPSMLPHQMKAIVYATTVFCGVDE